MFKRIVNISKKHSFFLFGPRATGKTTLLREQFSPREHIWVNLLETQTESMLRQNPEKLEALILGHPIAFQKRHIVIDEIQKNPRLLDVVHRLIFERKWLFALTGSSARKLKRGAANLLAGRAFAFECFPLTRVEMAESFDLNQVLRFGALPGIFELDIQEKYHYLRGYVSTYFKEEVAAEQLVRSLVPFQNFLEIASQANGKILNLNRIAKDVDVDHTTVQNYFSILEDTMVGFLLPPYHHSVRKRQRAKAKFYYFDLGVQRTLAGKIELPLGDSGYEFGDAFEHFVIAEIRRLCRYLKPDWRLSYLRTADQAEIDLIIERPGSKLALIEIKSTENLKSLDDQKMQGFKSLVSSFKNAEVYVVSRDKTELNEQGIRFVFWEHIFSILGLK